MRVIEVGKRACGWVSQSFCEGCASGCVSLRVGLLGHLLHSYGGESGETSVAEAAERFVQKSSGWVLGRACGRLQRV